jgi:hypothetical protein
MNTSCTRTTCTPFSMLALGARFKYTVKNENTYVKISNDITGECIAAWDDSKITDGWIGQGIYCLNYDGDDPDIYVVA